MRDRTGIPELDRAIEAFYADLGEEVEKLRTREGAHWRCGPLTARFRSFILRMEYNLDPRDAYTFDELEGDPDYLNYQDRTVRNTGGHTLNVFAIDGYLYTVDWTAAQYGYLDCFPLVQRYRDGRWERDW